MDDDRLSILGLQQLLFVARYNLARRIFRHHLSSWCVKRMAQNQTRAVEILVAELTGSTSPAYSRYLLLMLRGLPDEVLESSELLHGLFSVGAFGRKTVRERLKLCSSSLNICFCAK